MMHVLSRLQLSWLIMTLLLGIGGSQSLVAQVRVFCGTESGGPSDINDRRVIVGTQVFGDGIVPAHPFIYRPGGTLSNYSVPVNGCRYDLEITTAYGINNLGMIVGKAECFDPPGESGYLRLRDGTNVFLTDPHGDVFPLSINDSGHIVGFITGPSGLYAGFIRNIAGQTKYLKYKGTPLVPSAINDRGTIVGTFNEHGFTYFHHRLRLIQYTNSSGKKLPTFFLDINRRGEILGYYRKDDGTVQYFVFTTHHTFRPIQLPNLGESGAIPATFNSRGDVAGIFFEGGGNCWVDYGLLK